MFPKIISADGTTLCPDTTVGVGSSPEFDWSESFESGACQEHDSRYQSDRQNPTARDWHNWYAWRPIRVAGAIIWGEWCQRRLVGSYDPFWEYRAQDHAH